MNRWRILLLDAILILLMPIAKWLSGWMPEVLPQCVMVQYNLLCPACGGTRCVQFLFSGNFSQAFLVNPYLFFTILYVLLLLVIVNIMVLSKERFCAKIGKKLLNTNHLILWAIGYGIFGILRNFL